MPKHGHKNYRFRLPPCSLSKWALCTTSQMFAQIGLRIKVFMLELRTVLHPVAKRVSKMMAKKRHQFTRKLAKRLSRGVQLAKRTGRGWFGERVAIRAVSLSEPPQRPCMVGQILRWSFAPDGETVFFSHHWPWPKLASTPVCRLCGRYLALLGRPIRITVPAVTVAPPALVGSLIRSSNLPHSLQRVVPSKWPVTYWGHLSP